MNSKILIGIIVVVVLVIGGFFVLNRHAMAPTATQQNSQPQTQIQTNNPTSAPATAGQNAVTIKDFAFSPATLTVKVGDKVTWTNEDSAPHSATADDNSFDTGVLSNGQSGSVTFSKAGTYTYHCSVHSNMKATITVQ